jgi:hypothetical protein
MNIGDTVSICSTPAGHPGHALSWVITAIKTNDRGIWIQIDDPHDNHGCWHLARHYEVIHGCG